MEESIMKRESLFSAKNRVDKISNSSHDILNPGILWQVFTYRTKDGKGFFKFSYRKVSNYWEVDINDQPSYRSRASDQHTTHRLPSPSYGVNYKICVTRGCEPDSMGAAKSLSTAWAELTWNYIRTGKTIDDQVAYNALPWWKKILN